MLEDYGSSDPIPIIGYASAGESTTEILAREACIIDRITMCVTGASDVRWWVTRMQLQNLSLLAVPRVPVEMWTVSKMYPRQKWASSADLPLEVSLNTGLSIGPVVMMPGMNFLVSAIPEAINKPEDSILWFQLWGPGCAGIDCQLREYPE